MSRWSASRRWFCDGGLLHKLLTISWLVVRSIAASTLETMFCVLIIPQLPVGGVVYVCMYVCMPLSCTWSLRVFASFMYRLHNEKSCARRRARPAPAFGDARRREQQTVTAAPAPLRDNDVILLAGFVRAAGEVSPCGSCTDRGGQHTRG